jgi:outer membrane protein TolC
MIKGIDPRYVERIEAQLDNLEADIQQLRSERDELMKALEQICNADESTDFGKAIDQAISTINRMKEAGR